MLFTMSPLDAVWHLLNFLAPSVFVGGFSALAAKLAWRRELRGVSWLRMMLWSVLPGAAMVVGGLMITGRDGRIATYAAMVAASALGAWWSGFARNT